MSPLWTPPDGDYAKAEALKKGHFGWELGAAAFALASAARIPNGSECS